jgi:hypothetical protein
MKDAIRADAVPVLPGQWDRSLLEPLADINLQLLDALLESAAEGAPRSRLCGELRADWLRLTGDGCRRLASCPYLLLDAAFAEPVYWSAVLVPGVREQSVPGSGRASDVCLAAGLVRRALVLAWHLARSNPLAARIALGMSDSCTTLVAQCRLGDLELLAEQRPEWIRPRWEDRPDIWRSLLRAAVTDREAPLRQLQLRGLQLLAAGLRA